MHSSSFWVHFVIVPSCPEPGTDVSGNPSFWPLCWPASLCRRWLSPTPAALPESRTVGTGATSCRSERGSVVCWRFYLCGAGPTPSPTVTDRLTGRPISLLWRCVYRNVGQPFRVLPRTIVSRNTSSLGMFELASCCRQRLRPTHVALPP